MMSQVTSCLLLCMSRPMTGVSLCPEDTVDTGSRCCALPGSAHKQGAGRQFIKGHPTLQCHRPAVYIQRPGRWL
ncbi:unnamed protein product, partial [Staurois parvus]